MVTVNRKIAANTGTATFELLGLSTDTKPTGTFSGYKVGDNSVLMELDTGDLYYFNGGEWEKMSTSGQGGGSITVDNALDLDSENPVQNKVIAAALAALEAAKPLIVHGTADLISTKTAEITDEITLADIYSAAAAGRYVAFECPLGEGNTTRIPLAGYTLSENEYEIAFRVGSDSPFDHTKTAVVAVDFENSTTGTANIITSE